jgi:RNA polymerase sigma-70 factor (ECF subfamily)
MCDPVTAETAAPVRVSRPSPTDAALIKASLHDPARFAAVFDRHGDEIYRYATGRLGPDAADDVTAETFLTAFRKRGTYDLGRDDARPWLYGIATRWISEHRRTERRHYDGLARLPVPQQAEAFEEAAANRVAARQMLPLLARVLATLSQDERDLLLLVAWTDLSYAEVAQALGIAPGTVASRLHRVRGKVRKLLGDQESSQS